MIALSLVLLAGGILCLGEAIPWWAHAVIVLPALLWSPGDGWARFLSRNQRTTGLQILIDGAWIGLAIAWISLSLCRELDLHGPEAMKALWWISFVGTAAGQWISRRTGSARHTPQRELIGLGAVVLSLLLVTIWRADDLSRPLDGYWYLEGADSVNQPSLNLQPGGGWTRSEIIGDPEFGALRLVPSDEKPALIAPMGANGVIVLAARGPIGSRIQVGEQSNTVRRSMAENDDEGPVRRYLERGVAGIRVPVNLGPGEQLEIEVEADELYLFPSRESIWQTHASGALRWVHYYQILNQVENQVWAREVQDSRRLTLNQPPGWSPILAISTLTVMDDLPGATSLFLWVLFLVGATSVRLASLIAPGASWSAWLVPAGVTASHGLLMLEPMSVNFPDSLFAASILGVATALAGERHGWFAFLGVWAQALRWPGGILATILALCWWLMHRKPVRRGLFVLWSAIAGAGVLVLGLVWQAVGCMDKSLQRGCMSADAPELADLGFILYFETFPEHWHGEYALSALLDRVPGFYGLWVFYTGGGLLLALPFLVGGPSRARSGLRALLLAAGLYSLMLATIDHHPTHYFLPLVALTGPAVIAASATGRATITRHAVSIGCLVGLLIFLWIGEV